ncbi:MAG: AAA family ATPase [Gemmatimonadota bacterium]
MQATRPSIPERLPLCGRPEEYALLLGALDRATAGKSASVLLCAPQGMGKSRLAAAIREEAERRGFLAVSAAAYAMETGVPYSLFCDLLDPLSRDQDPAALLSFTRGAPEFQFVCPSLAVSADAAAAGTADAIPDLRNRLLWNFPPFLDRLRRDRPLLLVLEDVEWADPSSLELLHFLIRQDLDIPLMTLVTLDPQGAPSGPAVLEAARSLAEGKRLEVRMLQPLDASAIEELVSRGFGVAPDVVRPFTQKLARWTGGNPLFVTEVLGQLVSAGRIRRDAGRWLGWSLDEVTPPGSVRDLILDRLRPLSPTVRVVADTVAVAGVRTKFELLARAVPVPEAVLIAALEELTSASVLVEEMEGTDLLYAFTHPVVREVVYAEIGAARARGMHGKLAAALESLYGDRAIDHAVALAEHLMHAGDEVDRVRTALYLGAAGRQALEAHADREAVRYLERAFAALPVGAPGDMVAERARLLEDLARAQQRRGKNAEAARHLLALREAIAATGEHERLAAVDRRLGLAAFWGGSPQEALQHLHRGLNEARAAGSREMEARLRLARSACFQETARPVEAHEEATEALRLGGETGDVGIRVSAHMNLILLHTWSGPTKEAREHGRAALALAEEAGDRAGQLAAHWAMAVLEGLTGHPRETRRHLDLGAELADRLGSPHLQLRLSEVEIDYAARLGQWDRGANLAAEAIRMARELNQGLSLPRLLVLSGILHLGTGDLDTADLEIAEARALAGLQEDAGPATTHTAILVQSGLAALHLARGEFREAIREGEIGLALVDRSGYTAWAILRLLPTIAEASLHLRDLERAERVAHRLRADAERFENPLGLAWAEICHALVTWLRGDLAGGARAMERGAEGLEGMGLLPDAARLRRQLAGRLAELGDREAAVRELRRVHDILAGLGAAPELEKAREQFREVGARPPTRSSGSPGSGVLTAREAEIARFVGERKSNKSIARELGISPRTVGTHLSAIFKKMEVESRVQLGDLVREGILEDGA